MAKRKAGGGRKAPAKVSPVKRNTVAGFVSEIGAAWHQSIEGLMKTALLCAEASTCLTSAQNKQLHKQLPFGKSVFSKLAKIGVDEKIRKIDFKTLPPHYSTIYPLLDLNDHDFTDAVESGAINAKMTRTEAKHLVAKQEPSKPKPKRERALHCPEPFDLAIVLRAELSDAQAEQYEEFVSKIKALDYIQVYQKQDQFGIEMNKWAERVNRQMILMANKIVAEERKRRLKRKPPKVRPDAYLKQIGWYKDEFSLDDSSDEGRIREVLELVGRADEYEKLRQQAEARVRLPKAGLPESQAPTLQPLQGPHQGSEEKRRSLRRDIGSDFNF